MHDLPQNLLLRDLAVVMLVAGVVTLIFHRLRQPVVLGYILAGFIIGPHSPPFPLIADERSVHTLAELGVVFLMFSLGLEFSLRKLRKVGVTALITATLEILLMAWVGYEIGRVFGWRTMDCVFLGAMLSMSSTTIIVKVLTELGRSKEKFAELIFGILIVEDILAIVMIALLSGIAMTGSLAAGDVLNATGRLGVFLVVALVLGLLTVPRLLGYVARFKSNEMLLVTVLGLCFGVSLLAVKLDYSVALGAFVIGAVIAEAREIHRIAALMEPIRDMFSAVFFVAVGLMIDPQLLAQNWLPVVVITLAVVLGKIVSDAFGVFLAGHDTRTSLRVGMGLAQIGEFSFIIASLGLTLGVTSQFLYPVAVGVSAVTTLLTPYLIRSSDGVVGWFDRAAPGWLVNALGLYGQWLKSLRREDTRAQAWRLARKWVGQMVLNVAIVTAVFTVCAALADRAVQWWPTLVDARLGGIRAWLWTGATLLALPALIAAVRKLQAFAMLLAELSVSAQTGGRNTASIQSIISHTIFLGGTIALGLWVLVLSAALLPTGPVVWVWLGLAGLLTVALWRFMVQVHAKAQVALRETLAEAAVPDEERLTEERRQRFLLEAQLEPVNLTATAPAAGKLIRELELRTKTGASVVAIERGGNNVINPGPDDELLAGDKVLLMGNRDQIAAARKLLTEA